MNKEKKVGNSLLKFGGRRLDFSNECSETDRVLKFSQHPKPHEFGEIQQSRAAAAGEDRAHLLVSGQRDSREDSRVVKASSWDGRENCSAERSKERTAEESEVCVRVFRFRREAAV